MGHASIMFKFVRNTIRALIQLLNMRLSLDCKHKVLKSLGNSEGFENEIYYFTGARVTLPLRKAEN